jgi:predicted P-loop ATPase
MLKSTALKTLAQPWFTDELAELGTKDAAMRLAGRWVIEIAELDAMTRADVAKSRLSCRARLTASGRPMGAAL